VFLWTGLPVVAAIAVLIYLLWQGRQGVVQPGDLSLTPAAVPDLDAGPPEGTIPGGEGERVVIDREGRRAARTAAAGGTRWETPLGGYVGGVRPPHVVADADRAYVTHNGGVTALDARTGRVAWRSPGPEDRLLLSGDLLLATDCSVSDEAADGGRWLVARRAATGAEAFRVALPVKDFDPLPIEEGAGLFLVQAHDSPGGAGAALLIDRAGRVFHRFDRQVVAVAPAGADRLVLTSRDVVRLGADGGVRWAVPFADREWLPGGGLVPLPGGDVVAYLYCRIADSGVRVFRLDPAAGRKRWEAQCRGLGVLHSAYRHDAVAVADDRRVVVTSRGSSGTFVEALHTETGRSVGRRVIED
jgi:outer membrane protein assembly factor BamB